MKGRKNNPKVTLEANGSLRPPIVVMLGHVDHGKTTLLDKIRKTNIQAKEAGGITQTIGASVVATKEGKKITFIDTPGHAAFSDMRARGAKLADIAILVVAADDAVMPQTKEALEYILSEKMPFIVAATKIDLPAAKVDKVRSQLEKEGVIFEGHGGDVPLIPVSGTKGQGVDDLLEMISLVAELHGIAGDAKANLDALIIETAKDRRGTVVSLVVRQGTLIVGEEIGTESVSAKVRGIFDYLGKPVKKAIPGEPVQVIGFSELPKVGEKVWQREKGGRIVKTFEKKMVKKLDLGEIPVVIKASNSGSLEAVLANLPKKAIVIDSSVGGVNEADIFVAKAAHADIYAFESKVSAGIRKLAETEGVKVERYEVIYKLFEKLEEILESKKEKIFGKAKIVSSFPFDKLRVAGCKVLSGEINKSDRLSLLRNEREVGRVEVISIKKAKKDVLSVKSGEECGILFKPQLDFKPTDVLLSVRKAKF